MSTFSQWWKSKAHKDKNPKRVTWVCGTEQALVDVVVDATKQALSEAEFVSLNALEVDQEEIFSEFSQYPLVASSKLVEITYSEELTDPEATIKIAKKLSGSQLKVIFVSNEEHPPKNEDEETLADLKGSTVVSLVECKAFTDSSAATAVDWVQSMIPATKQVAGVLLERAAGDPRKTRDACVKLASLGRDVKVADVNELMREEPRDTFENALLALDKKTALLSIPGIHPKDYSRVIASMDSRVEFAHMVHSMEVARRTPSEISNAAGNKRFLLPELRGVTKFYTTKRVKVIRDILAKSDRRVQDGVRRGILENIVSTW